MGTRLNMLRLYSEPCPDIRQCFEVSSTNLDQVACVRNCDSLQVFLSSLPGLHMFAKASIQLRIFCGMWS